MIAPYETGLRLDVKSWAIPEEAFETIDNAYVWRGRVRKRFGAQPMNPSVDLENQQFHTRLRMKLPDPIDLIAIPAIGNFSYFLKQPGNAIDVWTEYKIGQKFNVAPNVYYEITSLAAGPQAMTRLPALGGHTGTFDVDTGEVIIIGENAFAGNIVTFIPTGGSSTILAASHSATGLVPGHGMLAGGEFAPGGMFSIAPVNPLLPIQSFTIATGGAGNHDLINNVVPAPTTATFNNTTGRYVFLFTNADYDGQPIYYYPGQPVMGLPSYEDGSVNTNPVIAFDTQFAYQYIGAVPAWERLGTAVWTGDDTYYFGGDTWYGLTGEYTPVLYVTNFNATDNIKYYNGLNWYNLRPITNLIGATLESARIIILFKGRLIALNTIETTIGGGPLLRFVNRARYCWQGDPTDVDAWLFNGSGLADTVDAPTKESILAATIIKDRLIVYFEASTWELVFTNAENIPFMWQQINSELGSQSTFSCINLDRSIIAIGNTGVHSCAGINVERIDNKIPNEIYKMFADDAGSLRVAGIRDFINEMIYWSVPKHTVQNLDTDKYCNKILAYNYKSDCWSYFDDSITAFGYYENQLARTWASMSQTWGSCDDTWEGNNLQAHPKLIVAGNQQGFTFLIDNELAKNSISLQITNITAPNIITSINHNLPYSSYVYITNCTGQTAYNDQIWQVTAIDENTLTVNATAIPAVYTGNGLMTLVSRVNILTKAYNFYIKENRNTAIQKVDFLVNNNSGGLICVDFRPSYSDLDINHDVAQPSYLELTPYALIPLESRQDQFWHPLYFSSEGEAVQFRIYYDDYIMTHQDTNGFYNAFAGFQLQAMTIYATRTSSTTR